jgi:steroid delta-isomerase-like uncharacterized protein
MDAAALAQAWASGWERRDVEMLLQIFTDDVMYEDVPLGLRMNRSELKGYAEDFMHAFADMKIQIRTSVTNGYRAASEFEWSGTHQGEIQLLKLPPTGRTFSGRGVIVFTMRDGAIDSFSDCWDALKVMKDLGLVP